MKYVKMLSLVVCVCVGLMAVIGVGTAAAATSTLCKAVESPCSAANKWALGTEYDFSLKSGTTTTFADTSGNVLSSCSGSATTFKGKLETDSTKSTLAGGALSALNWSTCSSTVKTLKLGGLQFEGSAENNGLVLFKGETQIELQTAFGECTYKGPDLRLFGKVLKVIGNILIIIGNALDKSGGSALCPSTITWKGEYQLTTPASTEMYVSSK